MTAYHILNKMRRLRNPLTQDVDNGELALLERIRRQAARSSGKELRLGIGDDCALIRIKPGEEIGDNDRFIDRRTAFPPGMAPA